MKIRYIVMILLAGLLGLGQSGCAVRVQHAHKSGQPLPPGQMKKVTGSQSAAPYAPGHRK